ncbi:MAG: murein L,D-transpeptidase catalytic domain family protein [Pseudomonadota bacterium]|uniref:murein L,D-transpeptidase catalytic domain-containing protein n=1 Tax=Novosphingobium sp. MBES04 TaxID=1206458 RepID=UPI00057D917D|nr:murein L,D-transpeptidase catalytic domain family protein [Novosphingobium sp. MBES04]MED5544056.1 murein L,D-transpeptidase catalytic domain family protein [Pseudomonadota bacterium]GAM05599.1 twin-arginine translocation pathway signal [Novosphingobium sp. MBES04]
MNPLLGRRHFLHGSLGAGLALTLPGRALAATAPATAASTTPYERRVLASAHAQAARVGDAVWRKDIVGMADFALPSWKPRLHFANLENGTVRSFLLAHGRGSDPEHSGWLQSFSNAPGSLATSRGAFLTCEWYKGKYGTSIRLVGLDDDNSAALERLIVVHPAWYADAAMLDKYGKLGRSEGCFAMGDADFKQALWHLSGGRLLYADRIGEG